MDERLLPRARGSLSEFCSGSLRVLVERSNAHFRDENPDLFPTPEAFKVECHGGAFRVAVVALVWCGSRFLALHSGQTATSSLA